MNVSDSQVSPNPVHKNLRVTVLQTYVVVAGFNLLQSDKNLTAGPQTLKLNDLLKKSITVLYFCHTLFMLQLSYD